MLDSYSRAIPTQALQGKTASLGEYCDPVDSYKNQNKRHTEDSEDSDPGYALPQDALGSRANQKNLHSKTKRSLDNDDDSGDLYELAQSPVEESNTPQSQGPLSKPSPKPRPSALHSQIVDLTPKSEVSLTKTSSLEDAEYKANVDSAAREQASGQQRPSKRCVDIEYEIASEIRISKQGPGPPAQRVSPAMPDHNNHSTDSSDIRTSRKSVTIQHAGNTQIIPVSSSFKGAQSNKRDFTYSMSQPTSVPQMESMYEEPWDLKARRLKQEEERASRVSLTPSDSQGGPHALPPSKTIAAKQESVYEDAWDTAAQQRKLEARLNFARSLSTTSDSDIFHDAVDNLPLSTSDASTKKGMEPRIKPLPTDTYEDAWDLKNSILDQKLRAMQVQASATYEEPWDLKKQHQQLQSRLSAVNPTTTTTKSSPGAIRGPKQRAGIDAHDQSWSGSDSHLSASPSNSRSSSKQLNFEDSRKASTKTRGSNIGQRINPMIPLPNQNWYHGNITRDDAEKMLRVCKEGSYIVRISSDRKSYSLSIKSAKQNIHVQIEQVGLLDGSVRYILGKNSREFCSIPEMIDYYTHHRVPLKGAEHITLLHPVECKWSSNNSQ